MQSLILYWRDSSAAVGTLQVDFDPFLQTKLVILVAARCLHVPCIYYVVLDAVRGVTFVNPIRYLATLVLIALSCSHLNSNVFLLVLFRQFLSTDP